MYILLQMEMSYMFVKFTKSIIQSLELAYRSHALATLIPTDDMSPDVGCQC